MTEINRAVPDATALGEESEAQRETVPWMSADTLRLIVQQKLAERRARTVANDALYPDLDPRVVASQAAVRDARRPDRLFQPGGQPRLTQMRERVGYTVTG